MLPDDENCNNNDDSNTHNKLHFKKSVENISTTKRF